MDKRIASIERDVDGWWIYLKPGWIVAGERTHQIVETRKKDALGKMFLVEPCDCDDCRRAIAKGSGVTLLAGVR